MDIDDCLVVMNGPRVVGVFDSRDGVTSFISKKYDINLYDIEIKRSFNGDYLMVIRGYPEFRVVKSRMY